MKYESTLGNNTTKLGLPQAVETLEELEYMEYDKDNYAELGMILDNMEAFDEGSY